MGPSPGERTATRVQHATNSISHSSSSSSGGGGGRRSSSRGGRSGDPPGCSAAPGEHEWRARWESSATERAEIGQELRSEADCVDVLRVCQLDAQRLETEMHTVLKEQLLRVFSLVPAGMVMTYGAELDLLLDVLIWLFSVCPGSPPPGCALMNLRLRNEYAFEAASKAHSLPVRTGLEGPGLSTTQRVLYLLLTAGLKYVAHHSTVIAAFLGRALLRWSPREGGDAAAQQTNADRAARRLVQRVEATLRLLSLANLLVFLHQGKYRSLAERVLGIRAVYQRANMSRAVSFEFMNRQLVWNQFSESLLLVLPLLGRFSWKLPFNIRARESAHASAPDAPCAPNKACPICSADPILMPFRSRACCHDFCYYCITTRCAASPLPFCCPLCSAPVEAIRRVVHGQSDKQSSAPGKSSIQKSM